MTPAHPPIDVRPITEAELPEWLRAVRTGFLREPAVSESEIDARRGQFEPNRFIGAFDGDRCVATFRSFAQEVTAVGGALVTADAVNALTLPATHRPRRLRHRRRGHRHAPPPRPAHPHDEPGPRDGEGARRHRGDPDRRRVPD